MKVLLLLFALVGFSAHAMEASYTSCSNGDIDKVGDSHYQIDIYEDGIAFRPYESGYTLDVTDIEYDSGTFSIVNKTTEYTSEGTSASVTVNAMLILDSRRGVLNAAISIDGSTFETYTLTCVQR